MAINISSNYKYTGKAPVDARMLVKTYSELLSESTWTIDSSIIAHNGMIVAVGVNKEDPSKNGVYYLCDNTITIAAKTPDVTNEANWHKLCEVSELDSIETKLAELEAALSTAGLTEEQVNELITTQITTLQSELAETYALSEDLKAEVSRATAKETELEEALAKKVDADYVTEAISTKADAAALNDYAKTTDVEAAIETATENLVDKTALENLATDEELSAVSTNLSDNYYTIAQTNAKIKAEIDNAQFSGEGQEVDLSTYVQKTELDTTLSGYATDEEVTNAIDDAFTNLTICGGNAGSFSSAE